MTERIDDISLIVPNREVPFFPSMSWELTNSDFDQPLYAFNWIQAFWDTNDLVENPVIVVGGYYRHDDGSLIASPIQFSFSGQMIQFKASQIMTSGDDRRGNAVTSLPINALSPTDSFTKVIVYGVNS